jgi:hypothetical protein
MTQPSTPVAAAAAAPVRRENAGWDPNSGTVSPLFNKLSFTLEVEVSEEAPRPGMYNAYAAPGATMMGIGISDPYIYSRDDADEEQEGELGDITSDDLASIALMKPSITFYDDQTNYEATFQAPAGQGYFTVSDLLNTLVAWEQQNRPRTEWFGGMDIHHVFFEGIEPNAQGKFYVAWGS